MKKVLLLVVCVMFLVPSFVWAACPNYEFGYKGDAKACIFGITFPIVGASVVLKDVATGATISKVTDAAGTYKVSFKTNNCPNPIGFFTQKWSVTVDAGSLGIPASKTCDASADMICCCEQCVQKIIQTCKLLYKFCC